MNTKTKFMDALTELQECPWGIVYMNTLFDTADEMPDTAGGKAVHEFVDRFARIVDHSVGLGQ
jgi:hypothetical protein